MVVYLVSCVSVKQSCAAPAADPYISPWFKKAKLFVERQGGTWWILSAKHGLTNPRAVIDPYEQTLNTMGVAARRAWAKQVANGLRTVVANGDTVVFLAGVRYREFLLEPLAEMGVHVSIPMHGLKIGEQLAWLDAHSR